MRGRAPLSCALCLIATSLPLTQCPFPVATQMNSVATWDLLTMTKLCRDLKFSCCDLVSTAYTYLCCDMEKSCCDIKLFAASVLCLNTEKLCRDMGFSLMPVLCRDLRAYVTTEKSPHHDNLCRDTESPVVTLNLHNLGNTLSRHKIFCLIIKSLHHCQLCRNIETFLS